MSTSGDTTFTMNLTEIANKVFARLGKCEEGEALTARMYEDVKSSINLLLKSKLGTSDHLFLRTEGSQSLTANANSYVLSPLPQRVLSVRRKDSFGREIPMNMLSRQEYFDLPNKTASPSTPVSWYFDPQRGAGTLYVWPAPDSTAVSQYTLTYTYLRTIQDMDNATDELDAPQEWIDPVIWITADDLETQYPVNDMRLAQKISAKAAEAKQILDYWDTEMASFYIQPDQGRG